ncbi:NAD(P)/FAD-dependent oxidoreductase [Anaeromyxobacter sp. Fw109-5]|uniref:flavin-containing monooxygenase n=1 Tax=Anaeromyxobacter sp. (strain Fw109-5) TaxID=404589 RepID=UPI0000ED6EF1|nr:NAD(P)/FAD-dependent oxidoreductase [Anaeromyxobacter sp. Fw109-5]ABS28418.1 putative flavoprotein [Anaeromyxobacter sp. Fw109-5]
MRRTDVVVIGGGQAGLAASRCLQARGVAHVVLERGRVAERWRSERWESLRLLTPRWQSRLPGFSYRGPDPDGFMSRREVIGYLEAYARSFVAPVEEGVTVRALEREDDGYRVTTDAGAWRAGSVIVATGHCDTPHVPALASELPGDVVQLVPTRYRNADALPPGGVLVVGASATGLQLADELHRSGRPVTLAVGRHVRLPRRYRGRDVMAWLDATGFLDEGTDAVGDLEVARRQPSLQLVGRPDHRTLDLGVLRDAGVRLVGRVTGIEGGRVLLSGDLAETIASAERRLVRLLGRIDDHVANVSLGEAVPPAEPLRPVAPPRAPGSLALRAEGIRTVLWATGYRRSYPWLRVPVLDARGEIRHAGGITPSPGLYVLGLQFLRRRKSSFLDGVGADAAAVVDHLAARLDRRAA